MAELFRDAVVSVVMASISMGGLGIMRGNWLYFLLLVISGIVVLLFICPYLRLTQHTGVCVMAFVALAIAFVYGRQHGPPRPKARSKIPEH